MQRYTHNRKWLLALLVATVLLVFAGGVYAQDEPTDVETVEAVQQVPTDIEQRAADAVTEAENLVEFAFNLLGIFEAISVAITVVGAALGVFGFARLLSAENSLTAARDDVEREIKSIREQFEADLQTREQAFAALSNELMQTVEQQRREASNATLATALITFGERQYRATDYQGALDTYQRALELDMNNPVTYYRLAYVYINNGELDNAEDNLKKSLDIDSEFAPAKAALGFVYRRKGEKMDEGLPREQMFNHAEHWMLDGLRSSPKLIDEDGESWWGALGGLYKKRGQLKQAIYCYEQAATVTPNSSYPFGNLAQLYGQLNNIEEMLKRYERVERLARAEVQAEVGNYWGYFDMLTAQLANGHTERAEENFISVVETVPPDAVYAFDILVGTLRNLANLLREYPQAKDILIFANRIAAYKREREQDPTVGDVMRQGEDTVTVEAIPDADTPPEG